MESAKSYDSFFGEFRLNDWVLIILLNLGVPLLDPLEEIILVGDELENTSVFAHILEGLIALYAFLLL
jgi:hypothetical protein